MFEESVIRGVKVLYGITVAIIVGAALTGAVLSWRDLAEAREVVDFVDLDRILFSGAAEMRNEIGTVGVALLTEDDAHRTIEDTVQRLHGIFASARQALEATWLGDEPEALPRIDAAYRRLTETDALAVRQANLARDLRDVAEIEPWRQAIYGLAGAFAQTSAGVEAYLPALSPDLADFITIRRFSYSIRDNFAVQCSQFRRSVQYDIPLTRDERDRWQREIGAYREIWVQMEQTASNLPDHPDVLEAVRRGRAKTAETQVIMSNVLDGLSGSGKPRSAPQEWSDNCGAAYASILSVGHLALDLAFRRAEMKQQSALVSGALSTLVLALAVGFSLVALHFIKTRLTIPLAALVTSIKHLESGNYQTPIPASRWQDEPSAIATTLESLRQKVLRSESLRRHLDKLRDDLVEQASRSSRAKSQFMAMMSHEIRTPLNGVLGAVQLLEGSRLSSAQRGWVEALDKSGRLLLDIVNDILDYVRIESGRSTVEHVRFSLAGQIAIVEATIRPSAERKGLHYTAHIADDVPDGLTGDPGKLGQILLNILGNAVKFTETGFVSLDVSLDRPVAPDGQIWLRLAVKDSGIGIPEAARPMLFEPFTQADGSVSRRFGGSGLGLSICKSFLELLGGEIGFDCPPTGGTIFTVRMPFAVPNEAGPSELDDRQAVSLPALKVLVAEDNHVNALIARELLERAGHEVSVAHDGLACIRKVSASDFDVILMDLSMPGLDGIETTRMIRALKHETRAMVPIIALTADQSAEQRLGDERRLFDGFVGKPYRWIDIEAKMAVAIGMAPPPPAAFVAHRESSMLMQHARDLGVECARKMVELYLSETPNMASDLSAAAKAGKIAEIEALAHRIKGGANHIGALTIARLASEVERAAEAGDIDAARSAVHALMHCMEEDLMTLGTRALRELGNSENSVAL